VPVQILLYFTVAINIGQLRQKNVIINTVMITKSVVVTDGCSALCLVCCHSGMYTGMFSVAI